MQRTGNHATPPPCGATPVGAYQPRTNTVNWLLASAVLALLPSFLSAQTVKISPGYTTIGASQTLQYSAAVTGLMGASVSWLVSGVPGGNSIKGTISATGLYTAPATIPRGDITVEAIASDKKTLDVVYVNVAPPGPAISSVYPNPIPTGNTTVTLTGTGFKSGAIVRWGAINLSTTFVNATTLKTSVWQGVKTPAAVFQVENPGTLWGAPVTVPFVDAGPRAAQTIAPLTANLNFGATQQFTSAGATSWMASAGSITATGLYTAPASIPAANPVTVTATGPGGNAVARVTVVNPNPQTIAPAAVTLNLGATQQFTSAGATAWSAVSGTVTAAGFYTAPAALPASGNDIVTVTGPNGKGTATVTLIPPTPIVTSVGVGNQLPLGSFAATIAGTGFLTTSTVMLGSSVLKVNPATATATALSVTGFAAASGNVNLVVSNGAAASAPFSVQVGVANAQTSAAAARRFLEQSAFGPTPTDAAHVQQIGFQPWLAEQFAMPQISNYNGVGGSQGGIPAQFLANAVTNPDQLRQRVAFALSQIFVTSINKLIWNPAMIFYQQTLLADSFTNYRQILGDVTLSPGMGQYLDMANNAKASGGVVANENYAREVLQLFSIGTNMLNADGSAQLDVNGLPVPTYSQFTVTEFARVFTGWTYAPAPGKPVSWGAFITQNGPMAPYPPMHDTGAKTLLNGFAEPGGLSPQADLTGALDNIFSHPNTGIFIGKQLIQHLVKSNPSGAYISRVAAAFADNGHGARGDMQAVIAAVLLDPEARANDNGGSDQVTDGHLQEPALFIAGMVRAFGGQMTNQNYYQNELASLGQDIYNPASVFNYYSPGFRVEGTSLPGSGSPGVPLIGGEFQIHTPNNAINRANEVYGLFNQYSNPVQTYGPGTTVDLTSFVALAGTPATLVDALDLTLTHGTMPTAMKQKLVTAVTAEAGGNLARAETGVYLILTSGYYNVWH